MPVLSEILSSIRARGSIYFCDKLDPPWRLEEKQRYAAAFHYVRSGQCWLDFGGEQQLLGPGDLVFVGHGGDHTLSSYRFTPSLQDYDAETHLLCGYFGFRDPIPSPLSESIPQLLVLRSDDIDQLPWLKTTLAHLSAEYKAQTPGANVVIDKLTEVVLVELIRFHLSRGDQNNFVAALYDKQIGKALQLLHASPDKAWTLETLSEEVGVSRAVFAKRFKSLVGQPMFQYLTAVRMRRACELLRQPNYHLADIAEMVGYSSDVAFGKAFRDHFSQTPAKWRKAHQEALSG